MQSYCSDLVASLRYNLQFNGNPEMMYDYAHVCMYYGKTRNDTIYVSITVRASGPKWTFSCFQRFVS